MESSSPRAASPSTARGFGRCTSCGTRRSSVTRCDWKSRWCELSCRWLLLRESGEESLEGGEGGGVEGEELRRWAVKRFHHLALHARALGGEKDELDATIVR